MAFQVQIRTNLSSPTNLANIRQQIQSGLSNINASVNLNITGATQQGIGALSSSLKDLNVVLSQVAANSVTAANAINRIATTVGPLTAAVNRATTALTGQRGVLVDIAVQTERGSLLIYKYGEQAGLAARRFTAFTLVATTLFSVVAGIRAGVGAALEFERQLIRLEQVAGGNRRELRAVADEISRVATAYGVSSRELAQTAVTLRQAGFTATQTAAALEVLAQSALSPNFGDLEETTEGLIAVMQQFNLTVDQASVGLNAINAVAADFAVEAKDIVSAVVRAGGAFATIGGDLNEFLAIFTSVRATTRESADAIATGLRTIFGRLQRSETIDALRELRINLRTTAQEAAALGNLNLTDQFVGPYEAIRRISEGLRQIQSTDPRYSAIVEQIGGFRQISRVLPLIQEEETRERALNTARGGSVSLIAAADTAQKSLIQTTVRLGEAFAETFRHLTNNPGFQTATRALLTLGEALNTVLRAAEPLIPLLITLGTIKLASIATPFGAGFFRSLTNPLGGVRTSVTGLATGGSVRPGGGPIGPTDTVPAMLTPGEYVFSRRAVEQIGAANLEQLHQRGVRGYAGGGRALSVPPYMSFDINTLQGVKGYELDNYIRFTKLAYADVEKRARRLSPGIDLMSTFSAIQLGKYGEGTSSSLPGSTFLGNFNPNNKLIQLNLSGLENKLGEYKSTLAHEIGHGIDFGLGKGEFASQQSGTKMSYLAKMYAELGLPISSYFSTRVESGAELFREAISPYRHISPKINEYRAAALSTLRPEYNKLLSQIPRRYSQGGLVGFNQGGLVGGYAHGGFVLNDPTIQKALNDLQKTFGVDLRPAFNQILVRESLGNVPGTDRPRAGDFNTRTGNVRLASSQINTYRQLLGTLAHEIVGHGVARNLGDVNVARQGSLRNIATDYVRSGFARNEYAAIPREAIANVASDIATNRFPKNQNFAQLREAFLGQVIRQFAANTGQLQQPQAPLPYSAAFPGIGPQLGYSQYTQPQARFTFSSLGQTGSLTAQTRLPSLIGGLGQYTQPPPFNLPLTSRRFLYQPSFIPPQGENAFQPLGARALLGGTQVYGPGREDLIRASFLGQIPSQASGFYGGQTTLPPNSTGNPYPFAAYPGFTPPPTGGGGRGGFFGGFRNFFSPPGGGGTPIPPFGSGNPYPFPGYAPSSGVDESLRFQRIFAGAIGLQLLNSYGLGSARSQVTPESGIGYRAFAGAQGAIGGAAVGALSGAYLGTFAQGTPFAGIARFLPVVGALIAGLVGLSTAVRDAAREIRQAQLDKETSKFKSSLEQLNLQLTQNGGVLNSNDFGSVRSSLGNQLRLVDEEASARAVVPYTLGLVSGSQNQFEAARRATLAQTFQGSAGEIFGFLSRSAQQVGRRNARSDIGGLENEFVGGNEGVNRQFISLIAQLQNRSLDAVIRSFRQDLIRGQGQELRAQAAGTESRLFVAFGSLASSVENAVNQLNRFDTVLGGLTGLVQGNISTRVPTGLANNLAGNLGTPFFGSVVTGATAFAQGQPGGSQLRDTLLAANRVAEVLPSILSTVLSEGQATTQGTGSSVRRSLLSNFGFTEDNVPETFRTVFQTIATRIAELDFEDFRRQSQDTQSLSRNLLQTYNPLIEAVQRLTSAQEQQVSSLVSGLEQYNRLLLTVIETQTRSDNARLTALRTQAQISAEAAGRPSETLRFLGNPGEGFFNARQNRLLAGTGIADQFNPVAIGAALQQTQTELTDAQTRLARLGPQSSEEGQRLARTIAELTSRATRLQSALQNLTNVTDRTANQQDRLRELDAERGNRQNFLSRFITGGPENRFQYERAFGLIGNALNNPRGLQGFGQDEAGLIIRTLEELRGISLPFAGGRRGEDVLQTLLQRTDPRLFGGINPERQDLQQQILAAQISAAKALDQLAKAQQGASSSFLERLEALQRQFFQDLERSFLQLQRSQTQSQIDRVVSQNAGLNALRPQRDLLTSLIGPQGNLETLRLPSVQNAFTSITTALERTSGLSSISEAFIGDAARQLSSRNLFFFGQNPENPLRSETFAPRSEAAIREQFRNLGINDVDLQSRALDAFARLTATTPNNERFTPESLARNLRGALQQVRESEVSRFAGSAAGIDATNRLSNANINAGAVLNLARQGRLGEISGALEAFRAQGIQNFEQLNTRLTTANTELETFRANLATINQQIFRVSPQQQQNVGTIASILGSGGGLAGLGQLSRTLYQADGGAIFTPRGTDTVPAMLTPGEYVVNRQSSQANRHLLERINESRGPVYLADGGPVYLSNPVLRRLVEQGVISSQTANEMARRGHLSNVAPNFYNRFFGSNNNNTGFVNTNSSNFVGPIQTDFSRTAAYGFSQGGAVYLQNGGFPGIPGDFINSITPTIPRDSRSYQGLVELARRDPRGVSLNQQRAIFLARRMLGISGLSGERIGELADNFQSTIGRRANLLGAFGSSLTTPGGASSFLTGSGFAGQYRNTLLSQLGAQSDLGGEAGAQQQQAARTLENLIIRNVLSLQQLGVSGGRNYGNVGGFFSTTRRPRRFFNSGGFVDGVDSVPAMLTPGEFVLNRRTVSQLGVNNLNRANYFQNGGVVGGVATGSTSDAATQTFTEAISSLSGRLEPLVSAFNSFERSAQLLSDALTRFPTTLTIEGKQTVEVIINGAQVLSQLQPEIQELVVNQTREALQRFVSRNFPDLNANEAS